MSLEKDSATVIKCVLNCLEGSNMDSIELPDQEPITLGRGPLTKIVDKRCSRHQLEVCADFNKQVVLVKQLGANASEVCQQELKRNDEAILREGDTLYILAGKYGYSVHFIFSGNDSKESSKLKCSYVDREDILNKKPGNEGKRRLDSDDQIGIKHFKSDCNNTKSVENKAILSNDGEDKNKVIESGENTDDYQRNLEKLENLKKMTFKNNAKKSLNNCDSKSPAFGWENYGKLLVFNKTGIENRCQIACFDFDGTIIVTKSGKVFPQNKDDFKLMDPVITKKLKCLYEDGYKIVFMTNQNGISKGRLNVNDFKEKVEKVIELLNVPVQVLVSTGSSIYRKPALGMWQYLAENNGGIKIDMDKSFYCGDAAGREANWAPGKKKDFSVSDRLFALNIGIEFYTPEELFLNYKRSSYKLPNFNPMTIDDEGPLCFPVDANLTSDYQEMIILVGYPGSGKTFFTKKYLLPKGYVHVNRDTLGSWQKCILLCEKVLSEKKSVVIDNTNPDIESRKKFIECANKKKVPCRCFFFALSFDHAKHNNKFRELFNPEKNNTAVNEMVMNSVKSKMIAPQSSEGFSEVIKINFVPKFENESLARSYKMFLF